MARQLHLAKMRFRHQLERSGSNIKRFANAHGVTETSIHRLFSLKHQMTSEPLRKQIALHMGHKNWDELINNQF